MNHYIRDLYKFQKSHLRNMWITYPEMAIYVRKGFHMLPDDRKILNTFDIANINVHEEHRGKGLFTWWLDIVQDEVKNQYDYDGIYIENVLNPRLHGYFERRGYERIATKTGDDKVPSFILKF